MARLADYQDPAYAALYLDRVRGVLAVGDDEKPGAARAVARLRALGLRPILLTGDNRTTAEAVARRIGIDEVIAEVLPSGKADVVRRLQAEGRVVAMVGDGVNDAPALRAARLAVAPGSAAEMARAVADVVLVRGGFAALPPLVGEGRRVLRNLQRVTKLFVTKSALAAFLILTVGLTPTSYPFLPRHLTLISALTIGIPAFFVALAPSRGPARVVFSWVRVWAAGP